MSAKKHRTGILYRVIAANSRILCKFFAKAIQHPDENKKPDRLYRRGIPRPVIETAIIIMAASAILSCSPISNWMSARIPWVQALVDTAGMVLVYYAYLRGMKPLQHRLQCRGFCP